MKMPRTAGRQNLRCNVVTKSTEEYFRIAIAIPFIDDFLDQLRCRFSEHKITITTLQKLLPKQCVKTECRLQDLDGFSIYSGRYIEKENLLSELALWKSKWLNSTQELPDNAIDALNNCNEQLFPNIFCLLKILATLPVTTATPERSFSTLKRLKTYLRNSTGETRLTGLALMSVHREVNIDTDKVIDKFSQSSRRKEFIL